MVYQTHPHGGDPIGGAEKVAATGPAVGRGMILALAAIVLMVTGGGI